MIIAACDVRAAPISPTKTHTVTDVIFKFIALDLSLVVKRGEKNRYAPATARLRFLSVESLTCPQNLYQVL
jgi:hypothetical protein